MISQLTGVPETRDSIAGPLDARELALAEADERGTPAMTAGESIATR